MRRYLLGPYTFFGLAVAVIVCIVDQASKLYLLFVHDLAAHPVRLGPFFDFVLTATPASATACSDARELGQWLLLGFKAVAVVALWIWLARAGGRLSALSLGLIIGGGW